MARNCQQVEAAVINACSMSPAAVALLAQESIVCSRAYAAVPGLCNTMHKTLRAGKPLPYCVHCYSMRSCMAPATPSLKNQYIRIQVQAEPYKTISVSSSVIEDVSKGCEYVSSLNALP